MGQARNLGLWGAENGMAALRSKTDLALGGAFLVCALWVCGESRAAPKKPAANPPAVQAVLDCRAITDGPSRLACFDKAVGAMDQAQTSGDLVTIDREQRKAVRRQSFGFSLPALAIFDKSDKPEEADHLVAKVASATQLASGKWQVTLEDGAVWRQTDDAELYKRPHAGSTADIRKGVLGSYFLKLDGQQAVRAHRDN